LIAGTKSDRHLGAARRQIPVMFFDPDIVGVNQGRKFDSWTLEARLIPSANSRLLAEARTVVNDVLGMTGLAAVVLIFGCLLAIQASRTREELATIRSDFVAAVTHELKTPIATIRMVGETIAAGRSRGPDAHQRYARITIREAQRLGRLIDNLLVYARLTDVTDVYSFAAIAVRPLVDESLKQFASQLEDRDFDVRVDIDLDVPPIKADAAALQLVLTNLIDNAIRYSTDRRSLIINAARNNGNVALEVSDKGQGIPDDEIKRVTERFFRGRNAGSGGSGLGLAIAYRIVSDHGGTLAIQSDRDVGTTVRICLPTAMSV
jgi:two-component system phosphate regulon sensor histidine kinase PhoR